MESDAGRVQWTVWWLIPLAAVVLGWATGCTSGNVDDRDDAPVHDPPTLNHLPDGGVGVIERDGGVVTDPDGGVVTNPDGGTDGGQVTFTLPSAPGWTFRGPEHGGPREVYGVTSDKGGNVWVAGGDDGLFLLTPGAERFQRFTHADGLSGHNGVGFPVISVSGGPSGTVYVGYRGLISGGNDELDPMWMQKTGDADKVVWNGSTLSITHYDISSPPGMYAEYPQGREKVRHIHRILYDDKTGNVWFGGNHGVAMYEKDSNTVWEHQHAHINGYRGEEYTMLSGDWYGIGLDSNGDLWMGGAHRVARLAYASEGGQFWASVLPPRAQGTAGHDVWPDAVQVDAREEDRTDDHVSDLVVTPSGEVWVGSGYNGLARISAAGQVSHIPKTSLVDPAVTSLERDPKDGSIWVGHLWGGITRLKGGESLRYSSDVFGDLVMTHMVVPDIQSDFHGGQRRILVGFSGGAVGIYTGE